MDARKTVVLIFIVCAAILTYLLLMEMPSANEGPVYKDKIQHIVAFAGLTFWGLLAFPAQRLVIMAGIALFGASMEVLQGILTVTRQPSMYDWFADLVGIALAWLVVPLWLGWWKKRRG
ncbi:hypothetical protein SAMN05192566_0562 [Methylophilus rhizosphaerae]|uniref:VanZ like family protein n=1 Tax=Methylophilus rhizosphaerae TaxID=492660 RepID=A0A1G8ZYQ1_9PROT|nr:VanZ family protein [Methylophilus rhizosphaerae]SDK19465.1 hypothetical protein SAMN05192566_0562 [Methylophilus rhizosphaerae]